VVYGVYGATQCAGQPGKSGSPRPFCAAQSELIAAKGTIPNGKAEAQAGARWAGAPGPPLKEQHGRRLR
jgi:hypothetical protein